MGYKKREVKKWTHEGPNIQKKRKKSVGHMKVHEKKETRKKDSHALKKNLQTERDHTKGVSIHHISSTISRHVHILI